MDCFFVVLKCRVRDFFRTFRFSRFLHVSFFKSSTFRFAGLNHYPEPRPLTNRERARIQSFPDDFVFFGSTTEVRRQIGNAVPPVGVHAVADALMPLFTGDYEPVDLYAEQERLSRLSIEERVKLF